MEVYHYLMFQACYQRKKYADNPRTQQRCHARAAQLHVGRKRVLRLGTVIETLVVHLTIYKQLQLRKICIISTK